jgi:hypothetical protein
MHKAYRHQKYYDPGTTTRHFIAVYVQTMNESAYDYTIRTLDPSGHPLVSKTTVNNTRESLISITNAFPFIYSSILKRF